MKTKIFAILSFFILFACKKQEVSNAENWTQISENVQFKSDENSFQLHSGKFNYDLKKSKLPLKKVVLLNASLVGFLTELGLEDRIIGVSSPEYIYSEKILDLIKKGKIENVGNEQKYDVEKIIALQPDAIFTNYIESFENTYNILKQRGIELIFLDEYKEQEPLQKAEYLRVFGKLFGTEKTADSVFNSIKNNYNSYKDLALKSKNKPVVLANEMYGSQWFLPGGKTFSANYFRDAGADYILKNNQDSKAVPLTFEEVFVKAENAQFWVSAGSHKTKKELLAINPNYAKMKVFQNGKIYTQNAREKGRANDFYESGVVRADVVLRDYIKIFHPEVFPNDSLVYMKELR